MSFDLRVYETKGDPLDAVQEYFFREDLGISNEVESNILELIRLGMSNKLRLIPGNVMVDKSGPSDAAIYEGIYDRLQKVHKNSEDLVCSQRDHIKHLTEEIARLSKPKMVIDPPVMTAEQKVWLGKRVLAESPDALSAMEQLETLCVGCDREKNCVVDPELAIKDMENDIPGCKITDGKKVAADG